MLHLVQQYAGFDEVQVRNFFLTLAAESIRSSWSLGAESAQRRMYLIDRHGSTPTIAESVRLSIFVN
jgi:hypothetical protein